MAIFLTSDNHFFHQNIIFHCNRPFKNVGEMNEEMIRRWNEIVAPGDTVYHLGDFSFKEQHTPEVLVRLNGEKHLVPGNHDRCHNCHKGYKRFVRKYLEYGFKSINQSLQLKIAGQEVILSHLPYRNPEDPDQRYQQFRPIDEGKILLHGHVHERWLKNGNMINVGVDVWNFTPVSLTQIEEVIREL